MKFHSLSNQQALELVASMTHKEKHDTGACAVHVGTHKDYGNCVVVLDSMGDALVISNQEELQ